MKHKKSAGVFLLTVAWVAGILTLGRAQNPSSSAWVSIPKGLPPAPIYLAEMISAVRSVTGPSSPDTSSGESLVQ